MIQRMSRPPARAAAGSGGPSGRRRRTRAAWSTGVPTAADRDVAGAYAGMRTDRSFTRSCYCLSHEVSYPSVDTLPYLSRSRKIPIRRGPGPSGSCKRNRGDWWAQPTAIPGRRVQASARRRRFVDSPVLSARLKILSMSIGQLECGVLLRGAARKRRVDMTSSSGGHRRQRPIPLPVHRQSGRATRRRSFLQLWRRIWLIVLTMSQLTCGDHRSPSG
jgi:hypothetical protein